MKTARITPEQIALRNRGLAECPVGTKLFCNGYPGTVTKICDGQLTGMAEVRLARGGVCVGLTDLLRFRDTKATCTWNGIPF